MMWHDMERRAPDVMRKSIVVVDCLADDSEIVIEKVTGADRPIACAKANAAVPNCHLAAVALYK